MKVLFIIFLLSLSACSMKSSATLDQKNACSIIKTKKSWVRALNKASNKWQVSPGLQLAFVMTESNFRPRAKTSRKYILGIIPTGRLSSAFGMHKLLIQLGNGTKTNQEIGYQVAQILQTP